ncbi:hypothetical protein, partial [Streptomyces sp. NPDC004783]|uniref:hypothetical protein n=1 Tax=Streptomyces sp. NPDC004783 TaxID=3154459 RepID=UPI0033B08C26
RRIPHHMTMIEDQELDVSPLTVHELVKGVAEDPELGISLMITGHGSGRSHGRAVGGAGAVVAEGHEDGAAAGLASAAAD